MIKLPIKLAALIVLLAVPGTRPSPAQETLIHPLSSHVEGSYQASSASGTLLADAGGNLYGATAEGGSVYNGGTVFELSPAPGGGWTEKILHNFNDSPAGADARQPSGPLIADARGNLYGVTFFGGDNDSGAVYQLTPQRDGSWTETVIHSFSSFTVDGRSPYGNLIFDADGNLYGTTSDGGSSRSYGIVYELTPSTSGWTEQILHTFSVTGGDGIIPEGGMAVDAAGNLYGTTLRGGMYSDGTVFELARQTDGTRTYSILHNFNSDRGDGADPQANPILDISGNLYGTTLFGGNGGFGTAYELSPSTAGAWTEKIVSIASPPGYPEYPVGPLVFDSMGELYGMTTGGGTARGGTVFELTREPNGTLAETLLYKFNPQAGLDVLGSHPAGGLTFGPEGDLYGTTANGGTYSDGTVFRITPPSASVRPVVTTTTLVLYPGTSLAAGEPITLTATVTAASGSVVPSGKVVFGDPEVAGLAVEVPLNSMGQAVLRANAPQAGSYSIVANYMADTGFVPSTSNTITRTVH